MTTAQRSNSKTTARALLASVMALLLCLATLLGTTYAWFTDSASTGTNTIKAGNLDIDVQYRLSSSGEYSALISPEYDANNILTNTPTVLFDEGSLWEPGHTEVAYLKVTNKGTLHLKYQLIANVISETSGINVYGDEFNLSDYLVSGYVLSQTDLSYANADEAQKAAGSVQLLKDYKTTNYDLAPNVSEYIAIVIYMPTTVGNEANYKTGTNAPSIDLGVEVVAGQATSEEDSYGNAYDADAEWAEFLYEYLGTSKVKVAEYVNASAAIVAEDENAANPSYVTTEETKLTNASESVVATIPAGVVVDETAADVDNNNVMFTLDITQLEAGKYDLPSVSEGEQVAQDDVYAAYEISLSGVSEDNEKPIEVSFQTQKNLKNVVIYHDGSKMEESNSGEDNTYTYDANTGIVTVTVSSFSPFVIVDGTVKAGSSEELAAAIADGGAVQLTEDISITQTGAYNSKPSLTVGKNTTTEIDLNNESINISSVSGGNGILVDEGATATFSNGTITQNYSSGSSYPVIKVSKSTLTLDNMTVSNDGTTKGVTVSAGSDGGVVYIKNSTIKGLNTTYSNALYVGSQSTMYVQGDNTKIIGSVYLCTNATLIISGGDFTESSYKTGGSCTVKITGGVFPESMNSLKGKVDSSCSITENADGTWTVVPKVSE